MDNKIIEKYQIIIQDQMDNIINLYNNFKDTKPIMLYDIQEMLIYAYPYNEKLLNYP